jgi:hypothetical protein
MFATILALFALATFQIRSPAFPGTFLSMILLPLLPTSLGLQAHVTIPGPSSEDL